MWVWVTFNVKNSSNKLVASESDIIYEITCTVDEEATTKKCLLNGTDKSTATGQLSSSIGCLNETDDNVDTTAFKEEQCSLYTWTHLPTKKDHYFEVVDEEGKPFTAHTTNPVPLIVTSPEFNVTNGTLADLAPTMLTI